MKVLRSVKSGKAYGAALLAVGLALTCIYLAVPLAEPSQLLLLLAAVVVSSWYGGLGPGLLATAVAVVGHTAFVEAPHRGGFLRMLLFVLVAGVISALAAGRRRAEDRAPEQREAMAVALAGIGDAVIVADRGGRVAFMNPAAERLTGWTEREARGRPVAAVFVLVNETTRDPVESPAVRVRLERQPVALPAGSLLARRGGAERAIDGSGAPIPDRAGDAGGVVLVFRDLTERRAVEREYAEVLAREQAARRDAAALSAVGQALVQSLDTESAGRHIAEGIRALLGGTVSVLWELEHATNRLVAVATSGSDSPFPPGTRIRQDEALAGFAVSERRPVSTSNILTDPRLTLAPATRALVERSGHGSVLAVPLMIGGRVTGVLAVGDVTGRAFGAEEIRRLQDFANQAAIAVEKARLFALETSRREQVEALATVQRDLSAELDLDRLLGLIVERAGRLFDGAGFAYLFDEERQSLDARTWGRIEPESEAPFPAEGGMVASCAEARRGLLVNDYPASPYALSAVVRLGVRHAMAQPLVSRDRLLGVLAVARRVDVAFRPEDFAGFEGLAVQAAVAIDNAILFVEAGRRRREAEVLAELARSINTAQDVSTVLQRVVDGARELCRCDLTSVALRETQSGSVVMRNRAGEYRGAPEALGIVPGRGAGGLVLESGRPFRSDNMAEDPRITHAYADAVRIEGLVATLVVPIMVEGRVEGLLYVHRRTPKPFDDRTETVLRQLAEYAAIAIHNMRMLAHEHQMRAEAESASRTKDEFLATLSHELRSPLQPLLNWAYLLRSPNLDPASAERALDAIERSTKTLGQLIEDLLDVSRIVTGKLRLQARPVRLPPVVRAAMEAVESAALAKSVTLEARMEPDLPAVMGDPDRIQQVLWNLLSNGIKFTPKGGRVTVAVAGRDSEIVLTVADTGAGIKREFLPHVFERFRQAESSTNRAYGGLGLGLAIVRHLVELHGGSVAVQSEGEGQGATFSVRLPVAAIRTAERAPAAVSTDGPVGQSLSGLRLLIVDDEADAREVMRFMLERGGAQVRIADSAAQALDAIREERPDLLISDIGMPVEDGYVLVRRLRAMEAGLGRRLPAIALTAYASEEDTRRALAAGFDSHLSKPVDPARLMDIAAGLASGRRESV
ncbi:MAG TPA: GAF domain-containing protein [Candidatus Limnocylindria bacterium]|nr:GAF domain-containing protein [Candidatus Limnocylindria bacterium]